MLDELKKGFKMKIQKNLSREEKEALRKLKNDKSRIICPADKGKAVVVEDTDSYLSKLQDQIDEGEYKLITISEKTILKKLHKKLMNQLISMGITDFNEQKKYSVTAPVMASIYLLTYKICKILTDILMPLDEKGEFLHRELFSTKADIERY